MGKPPNQSNLGGALFALLAFGIFASNDAVVKFMGGTYSPFQTIFFSVLFSFPLVTIMLIHDQKPGNLRPKYPVWTVIRTCTAVITSGSIFYAFANLPLTEVYAIVFTTPLLITVLSIPLLGEVVRLRRWAAVIVGLIGVAVVLRPGHSDITLGHVAALVAAVGSALAAIIMRKIGSEERSVVLMVYPMLANFLVAASILPFIYKPIAVQDLGGFATIAVLGFVAMLCLITAYRKAEAVIVAPMQYSQILWATAYGTLFFGETPDITVGIGALIIIGSGVYILVREAGKGEDANKPVLRTMHNRPATGLMPRVGQTFKDWRHKD